MHLMHLFFGTAERVFMEHFLLIFSIMADDNMNQQEQQGNLAVEEFEVVMEQRQTVVTRMERWIQFMATPAFAEMDFYVARSRVERGTALYDQLNKIQLDLVRAAKNANRLNAEIGNDFMELEERYFEATTRLTRRFVELTAQQPGPAAAPAQAAAPPPPFVVQIPPQQDNLQNTWGYFDGNSLLKWKEFKQRFEATIHNNDNVSVAYKFTYLKNSLKGKALQLIAGYEVTEDNYGAARERLNKEYDRKYPLARAYLQRFFQLKEVSNPATAEELQRLSNVTMETVRNLQSLGYPVDQWNMLFVHVLHGLLQPTLGGKWNLELLEQHGDEPTIAQIVAFLDKHATAAVLSTRPNESITVTTTNEHAHRSANRGNSAQSSRNSSTARSATGSATASSHGSAAGPSEQKWKYPCGKCGQNHKIFFCPEFLALNYNGRMEAARKRGICVLCLKRGHDVTNCFETTRCKERGCQGAPNKNKHNSLMCQYQVERLVGRTATGTAELNSEQRRKRGETGGSA